MTKELLNKLPEQIFKTVMLWKSRYNDDRFDKKTCKAEIRGYIKGLKDSGVIRSDTEYRVLFTYMTL